MQQFYTKLLYQRLVLEWRAQKKRLSVTTLFSYLFFNFVSV